MLRVCTLFSGYDSQCLTLERLKRQYPDFDYTLVAWSEIDAAAIKAHDALFPQYKELNLGDICKVDWEKAPDCDLITWSFPCTNLSSAGQQTGMAEGSGTASSLAWEALKAIRIKRPRYALMENVKALISKQFIGDFKRLMSVLKSYGYTSYVPLNKNGEYTTLNASDYGVPQNRERVFMVSILGGGLFEYYFPEPFPLKKRLKDVLEDEVGESYYLSDERVAGLIQSTLKEKAANRGFEFKPKTTDEIANTLTGGCVTRKTDNFIVCGAIRGRKDNPDDEKHHLELELNSATESNTITSVQKDNVVVLGNSPDVANTVTSHYAKEKTSDLLRDTFGGGSFIMERKDEQGDNNH